MPYTREDLIESATKAIVKHNGEMSYFDMGCAL